MSLRTSEIKEDIRKKINKIVQIIIVGNSRKIKIIVFENLFSVKSKADKSILPLYYGC